MDRFEDDKEFRAGRLREGYDETDVARWDYLAAPENRPEPKPMSWAERHAKFRDRYVLSVGAGGANTVKPEGHPHY